MSGLATRSQAVERMDDEALDQATYSALLGDLARVNRLTLAYRPTLAFVAKATVGLRRFRLLDVGFGQGDMLRAIASQAARHGVDVELVGVDLNPRSVVAARAVTPPGMPIAYRCGDYADVGGGFDLIVSSLVAHHMREGELLRFLRFMEAEAARGWFVNDLHRHRLAHLGYPVLAAAMRCHPIVRADGRTSIARAFRTAEWDQLLDRAGIAQARCIRHFPFRLCVERLR